MKVLFVGDVVGRPGREAVHGLIPGLRQRLAADVVVVNCENAAAGRGVTPELARGFLAAGVDVLTGGNHIWRYREIGPYLEEEPRLVRPANYPHAPGRGSYRFTLPDGRSLGVLQVEGRVFMRNLDCPFEAVRRELAALGPCTATLLDVHAEASSEKQALAWHFDGQLSAVIGTHTHVQTADERVLPRGTALLTDAGMTGPFDSVIGMAVDEAVKRFLTQRTGGHDVATDNVFLCGALVDIDDAGGRARRIERVKEPWPAAS
jgi:metallophosphoesterase (TIGR00282 family)